MSTKSKKRAAGSDESWWHDSVAARNLHLLQSGFMADCTFVVGNVNKEKIQCHKSILSQSSSVFYAMFNGELQDEGEVKVDDIEPQHFRKMLEFIYTDYIKLMKVESALKVCHAANKYMIKALTLKCIDFIKENLDKDTVWMALQFARLIDNAHLEAKSLQFLQLNTHDVLNTATFPNAEKPFLLTILNQNHLTCITSEVDLFSAFIRWAKAQQRDAMVALRDVLGPDVLSLIRFLTMTAQEFASVVVPSKLLEAYEERDIFCRIVTKTGNLPNRFNHCTDTRATLGPKETIDILKSSVEYTFSGQEMSTYPFSLNVNSDVFILGLKFCGLQIDEISSFVKDSFVVELFQGSELLASAEFEGLVYYYDEYVEVDFNGPILLKANTNYTLKMIYKNTNLMHYALETDVKCYLSEGVKITVDFRCTAISGIHIAHVRKE